MVWYFALKNTIKYASNTENKKIIYISHLGGIGQCGGISWEILPGKYRPGISRTTLYKLETLPCMIFVWYLPSHGFNCASFIRCKYNLNELSHDTAIGLIEKVLAKEVNLKEVRVQTFT